MSSIRETSLQILAKPLERPVEGHPYLGRRDTTCIVLVRLKDGDGREGFGLAHVSSQGKAQVLAAILREVLPLVADRSVFDHQAIYQRAATFLTDLGRTGATLYALAALDVALWDLLGKTVGQPLAVMLGGGRDRVPCYSSAGLRRHQTPEQLQEDAASMVRQGFRAMKLRLGSRSVAEDVERARLVREAIGPEVDLMVDLNWAFAPPDAIRLGRLLEPLGLYWIEDPVAGDDVAGLAEVSRALDTRVTFGEVLETAGQFQAHLVARSADCYMIDLQKVGGVGAWMRIAALLDAWHMPAASHVMPEVQVHLVAAAVNGLTVEYNPHHDFLYEQPLQLQDGEMLVPTGPGLGLRLNEDVVRRYSVS